MIDALPDGIRTALIVLLGAFVVLATLANRYPAVAWLRFFRMPGPGLSDAQRERLRRSSNIRTGVQLIGIGLLLPFGYLLLEIITLSEIETGMLLALLAGGVLCVALGIAAIVRA